MEEINIDLTEKKMQSFNQIYTLDAEYLYATRTGSLAGVSIGHLGRWDGTAGGVVTVGGGMNDFGISVITVPGTSNLYVAGRFTQVGGALSANRVAKWDGSAWDTLGSPPFDNNVTQLAYDAENNLLYAGSHGTSATLNRVAVYDGTTWTGIAQDVHSSYIKLALDGQQRLYVGTGGVLRRYTHSTQTWETLSSYVGGTINDLKFDAARGRVWIAIYSSADTVKYWDLNTDTLATLAGDAGDYLQSVALDHENVLYAAVQSPATFEGSVVRYDEPQETWTPLYNYQATSGVLSIVLDTLKNAYVLANAGGLTIGRVPYAQGDWQSVNATTEVTLGGDVRNPPQESGQSGGDPHIKPVKGDLVTLSNRWKIVRLYENQATGYVVTAHTRLLDATEQRSLHRLDKAGATISIDPSRDVYVSNLTYFHDLDVFRENVHLASLNLITGELRVLDHQVRSIQALNFVEGLLSLTHKKRYPESDSLMGFRVHLGGCGDFITVTVDRFWDDINHLEVFVKSTDGRIGELIEHDDANCLALLN